MSSPNLLGDPPPTLLPEHPEARTALVAARSGGGDLAAVAARFPGYPAAWAALADRAYAQGEVVASYAYARTGYHRSLDQLRRAGWKGFGPVPWSHEPNRGFLDSLRALGRAADAIGEGDEAERCATFLAESAADYPRDR
ncbi:MAG: DUF3151 domain-containing protein [Actinomycetes bacterium]